MVTTLVGASMVSTKSSGAPTTTMTVDAREHGFDDGPAQIHVEVNWLGNNRGMAILAAGADGRYSFDFRISGGEIEITKAYVEGMREPVDGLPQWIGPIREEIEQLLNDHETGVASANMATHPETDGGQ